MFQPSLARRLRVVTALLALGCGTEEQVRSLTLEQVAPAECGAPSDAQSLIVRALGHFEASEATAQAVPLGDDATFSIDRFPPDTRLLELEVRGFGGRLAAVGRTPEFDLATRENGQRLPVFMSPPEALCELGGSEQVLGARAVRVGHRVFLLGGPEGHVVYDPRKGQFETLPGSTYGDGTTAGLIGASLVVGDDGRAVAIGGVATAYQQFLPGDTSLQPAGFYRESRAFHGALYLDTNRVLLAGGCSQLQDRECVPGSFLLTSSILALDTGELTPGPALQLQRIGGALFQEPGGSFLFAGGVDDGGAPVEQAERFRLGEGGTELVAGLGGRAVQHPSASVWSMSADAWRALPPLGNQGDIIATRDAASVVAALALADGSALTAAQDGRLWHYRNLQSEPVLLGELGVAIERADLLELEDGNAILVSDAGIGSIRTTMVGPLSPSATASFASIELARGLDISDLGRTVRVEEPTPGLVLESRTEAAHVLIAGLIVQSFELDVAIRSEAVTSLIFGWTNADNYSKVEFSTTSTTVAIVENGQESLVAGCVASGIDLGPSSRAVRLRRAEGRLELRVDGEAILECPAPVSGGGGQVGVLGAAGSDLVLGLLSVTRL